MDQPDLFDLDQRAAYRNELRGVAIPQRFSGLGLTVFALVLFLWPSMTGTDRIAGIPATTWGWIALIMGWVLIGWAILIRTRYHRRRTGGRTGD